MISEQEISDAQARAAAVKACNDEIRQLLQIRADLTKGRFGKLRLAKLRGGVWYSPAELIQVEPFIGEMLEGWLARRIEHFAAQLRELILAPRSAIGNDNGRIADGGNDENSDTVPQEITLELSQRWIDQAADRQQAEN